MKLAYKLGIGIGIVTLLLVVVSVIGIVDLNSAAKSFKSGMEITDAASEAAAIETDFLQVRRSEKDFVARKNMKYFERANSYLDSAEKRSNHLLEFVDDEDSKHDLQEILIHIDTYREIFSKLKENMVIRGLTHNDGVQKAFRAAAHKVQNSSTGSTKATILELRKHEKDYMLRLDHKYVNKASDTLSKLRGRVSNQILDEYWNNFTKLVELDGIIKDNLGEMKKNADETMEYSVHLNDLIYDAANVKAESVVAKTNTAVIILSLLSVFALVIAVTSGLYLVRAITKPVLEVVDVANSIASGDFSHKIELSQNDEIGELASTVNEMSDALKQNREEMEKTLSEGNATLEEIKRVIPIFQEEGDIEVRPNPEVATGSYRELLQLFKDFMDGFVADMLEIINGASSYADGNFEFTVKDLPGKKIVLTDAFNKLRSNLLALIDEGVTLATAAEEGDLQKRGETAKFEGDYKKIIGGMNKTIENILEPVNEAVEVLKKMAEGNLNTEVTGDYKGDHAIMKTALNTTIESLNDILNQVNVAVEQVNSGSQQVSDSSQSLSQGATEQASSLEEVTSSITQVGSQTKLNAENATQANQLANSARGAADKGNDQMQQMLGAMSQISDSSNEISKIIKVIDEIAFQTNLLALNAAVEAARAGVHGKGFAVVADEVRNLAQRSAQAAKETTDLIEGTVQRVENGSSIADETAEAFAEIISGITKVNDLVGEIESASKEQTVGINQIGDALTQIDSVTQANTSNAEEGASAAEELSSQATHLRQMVTRFELKSTGTAMTTFERTPAADTIVKSNGNGENDWDQKALPAEPNENKMFSPEDTITLEDSDFEDF